MKSKQLQWGQIKRMHDTLESLLQILQVIGEKYDPDEEYPDIFSELNRINSFHRAVFSDVVLECRKIDFQASKQQNRIVFRRGVDEAYDEAADRIESVPEVLNAVSAKIQCLFEGLDHKPNLEFSVATGICGVALSPEFDKIDDIVELLFKEDGKVYYQTDDMVETQRFIYEWIELLLEEEQRMTDVLCDVLLKIEPQLKNVLRYMDELDVFVAAAETAVAFNMTCPQVTNSNVLTVRNCRNL
ncbi:MAG: hypothetical protein MHM6MM_002557 [Cercozoa sp. M6MM]